MRDVRVKILAMFHNPPARVPPSRRLEPGQLLPDPEHAERQFWRGYGCSRLNGAKTSGPTRSERGDGVNPS
jgi:hypothetical protein